MGKAILMGQVLSGGIHFVCPSLWSTRTHVQTELEVAKLNQRLGMI